jgi:hypothetical protein
VSGGYGISAANKVTGASAGSVALQGYSIVLNGELRGQAMPGYKGGTIDMAAGNVNVASSGGSLPAGFTAASVLPDSLKGKLILGGNQFDATGFTNITLKSVNDLTVEGNVTLAPSMVKLAKPASGVASVASANPATVTVSRDLMGGSSVTLGAGSIPTEVIRYNDNSVGPMNTANPDARLTMAGGSAVTAGPSGTITMSGPYIDVAGTISAPGGTIGLTATNDLHLRAGAGILAEGYNKVTATPAVKGLSVASTPVAGGSGSLAAGMDLLLEAGSLVSVSGSSAVEQTTVGTGRIVSSTSVASDAGSVSLSYGREKRLDGELRARTNLPGLPGGTLTLAKTTTSTLSLSIDDLARFRTRASTR